MEKFKNRGSQMSLSDLHVLKGVMNDYYEQEISITPDQEDKKTLLEEQRDVDSAIKEVMLSKAINIVLE